MKITRAEERRLEGVAGRLQEVGLDVDHDPLALDTPVRDHEDAVDRCSQATLEDPRLQDEIRRARLVFDREKDVPPAVDGR